MDDKKTETTDKHQIKHKLTDRNAQIAELAMSGMSISNIAKELNIGYGTVWAHLNKVKTLMKMDTESGNNAITDQRSRLSNLLKKTVGPMKQALKREVYSQSPQYLRIGVDTALAINRGLGVLKDHQEIGGQVDVIHQRAQDRQAYIESMELFGKELLADYEIIDDNTVDVRNSGQSDAHTSPTSDNKS